MTTRTIVTCPGGVEDLRWSIANDGPLPQYSIIIKDNAGSLLLDSDYQAESGSIPVIAPSAPGNYTYTITVARDDFGHLSDTEHVFLNVTQISLSHVFAQNNPVDPGTPFSVYWTIHAINPQSDELAEVSVTLTSDQLMIPENNFKALYKHGETGRTLFIAPNTEGIFPITVTAVSRFGCIDTKTIMLQTGNGGIVTPTPITVIAYFPGIVLIFLLSYLLFWLFLLFFILGN